VNPENLTIWLAFIAGFVSFISPCVLPLVPAYIGYMGGRVTNTVAAQVTAGSSTQAALHPSMGRRFTTALHGLSFVAGFTFVFVTIGLLSTAFIRQIGGQNINAITGIIGRVGGVVIIFFGLHFMGGLRWLFNRALGNKSFLQHPLLSPTAAVLGAALILWGLTGTLTPSLTSIIPTTAGDTMQLEWATILAAVLVTVYLVWLLLSGAFTQTEAFWTRLLTAVQTALYTDTRRQMTANGQGGYASSAIMGVVFAAGWTPCIGPVYGAVLTLAAQTGNVGQAGPLLAAYSLGLGVPFIATALLLDGAQGILRRLQRQMHRIELVSGAFLILIGVLVATGQLQSLSQTLTGRFGDISVNLEKSVIDPLLAQPTAAPAINAQPTAAANSATALGSITGAAANIDAAVGLAVGNRAPDFQTVSDTGQNIKLSDLRGKVVILNFWATWCGPCRVEMPEFQKAYTNNADKGFAIVAVNNIETQAVVKSFRKEMNLTFPLAMDENGDIQKKYAIQGYPTTYVLNRSGIVTAWQPGPLTASQIETLVNNALKA
jgi:cytochrome c biogenesis protein CcdA/peroxiredoxin